MADQTVEEIARGLSGGERDALVLGKWNVHPVSLAMMAKGMADSEERYSIRLTPLGLAVRRYLMEQGGA